MVGSSLSCLVPRTGLEADDDVGDDLAVAAGGALGLLRCELGDLAFVHLLVLLDAESDGAPEVLHEDLSLLDLGGVDLAAHHGAEGYLGSELLRDAERERGLAGTRRARHEQRAAGHLLSADHVDHHPARLARLLLAHPSGAHVERLAVILEAETLFVHIGGDGTERSERSARALTGRTIKKVKVN
jgi:hypothetical protein